MVQLLCACDAQERGVGRLLCAARAEGPQGCECDSGDYAEYQHYESHLPEAERPSVSPLCTRCYHSADRAPPASPVNWPVAASACPVTVVGVATRDIQARIIPTPFVSSFIGQAREGNLHDHDPQRRAAAWARWAIDALEEFKGLSDREYVGLVLPGRFHDMGRSSVPVRPHLEIPTRVLERPDPEFPQRLAQAGNALCFPWWVVSEVTAVRRVVFNGQRASLMPLLEAINAHHAALVSSVESLNVSAGHGWAVVEEKLVADPSTLLPYAVEDFSVEDVASFFPPAADLNLKVVYDPHLRSSNGDWAVRRLGAWRLVAGDSVSLGVVTPRLTRNSLFGDSQFLPASEAPASLLVRGLVLRRLLTGLMAGSVPPSLVPDPAAPGPGGPYLRAVVARPGAKLPEASMEAAVHFLQTFPDAEQAWSALQRWAGETYLLTISHEGYLAAHRNAIRYMRRAETPERDDVNLLLPLAWDDKSRVVRVTFSKPGA